MPAEWKREGYIDSHFRIPANKRNAYDAILAQEGKTLADDLNEFVNHRIEQKRIEQNPVLQANPLNLSYGNGNGNGKHYQQQQQQQQPQSQQVQQQQSDLRIWLTPMVFDAIQMAKKQPLDAEEWTHLARTFATIARKKREGNL